jgi:hypothetical protein
VKVRDGNSVGARHLEIGEQQRPALEQVIGDLLLHRGVEYSRCVQ